MDYLIKKALDLLKPSEEKKDTVPSKCFYAYKNYSVCATYPENICSKQFEDYMKCVKEMK
jgi:hypothetical protein